MSLTEKQIVIMQFIKEQGSASASDFGALNQTEAATYAHLNRLVALKQLYISHWVIANKHGVKPVFKIGDYPSISRAEAAHLLRDQRREAKEREQNKAKRTMDYFDPKNPRPDIAAAWLFNKPRVKLLGAKYESRTNSTGIR